MDNFKGYVLQSEIAEKAKTSNSLFNQLKNVDRKKMGIITCLRIDSLPEKYRKIAKEECLDLERYVTFSYFSNEIGISSSWLFVTEARKKMKFNDVKIGGLRLFELSEEFLKWSKDMYPFKVTKENEHYAVKFVEIQGIKIGFY